MSWKYRSLSFGSTRTYSRNPFWPATLNSETLQTISLWGDHAGSISQEKRGCVMPVAVQGPKGPVCRGRCWWEGWGLWALSERARTGSHWRGSVAHTSGCLSNVHRILGNRLGCPSRGRLACFSVPWSKPTPFSVLIWPTNAFQSKYFQVRTDFPIISLTFSLEML